MIPYEVGYVTARRVTSAEDKEAMTHMVRACDKNGRRTIRPTVRPTLSYRRRKKSESTAKNMDVVHHRRCRRAREKHRASTGTY